MGKTSAERMADLRTRRVADAALRDQLDAALIREAGWKVKAEAWEDRALTAEAALARLRNGVVTGSSHPPEPSHSPSQKTSDDRVTGRDGHGGAAPSRAAGISSLSSTFLGQKQASTEGERDLKNPPQVTKSKSDGASDDPVTAPPKTGTAKCDGADPVTGAFEELRDACDLYPEAELEIGDVAKRIARAVTNEPTARRAGVTPAIATREAIVAARTWFAEHPKASSQRVLAQVERHATDYVLRDCRNGSRRSVEQSNGARPKRETVDDLIRKSIT